MKRNISFFLGTNVFATRSSSVQSSYEPAARGNGFQGATRDEKISKYQTYSALLSCKFAQELYLCPSLKRHLSNCNTTSIWLMNEPVCSSANRIASERVNFTLVRSKLLRRVKWLNSTLTINILILLSPPILSSSNEEHGQIRHHQKRINPRLHTLNTLCVWFDKYSWILISN